MPDKLYTKRSIFSRCSTAPFVTWLSPSCFKLRFALCLHTNACLLAFSQRAKSASPMVPFSKTLYVPQQTLQTTAA